MKKTHVVFLVVILFISACATTQAPPKTQLQIREFQTRTYGTNDIKMVMKAMLNVLQDDGFIVKNASVELGLLSATKEVYIENKGEAFVATLLDRKNARWKKNSIIESTANVSEFGKECRVRVNFQLKVMDNRGGVVDIQQIEDQKYYQDFFSKVDKGIFIQKEKL